jgi:transcriptional repressor NrdR
VLCTECQSETRVLESRRNRAGDGVRRRRECRSCGARFTTLERLAVERVEVRKRSGGRQPFDAAKLRGALVRAAHKRDVSALDLERIVQDVEREAREAGGVIAAGRIGEVCLEGLARLDRGAYLQFAGTLPDTSLANPEFADLAASVGTAVPSGSRGSMPTPRKSVPEER